MDKDFQSKCSDFLSSLKIESKEPESILQSAEIKRRVAEKSVELEKHTTSYVTLTEKDFQVRLLEQKVALEKRNLTYADMLNFAAMLILTEETNDLEIQVKNRHIEARDLIIEYQEIFISDQKQIIETLSALGKNKEICRNAIKELEAGMEKYRRKKKATKAADTLHDLPGGSREKQEKIRKIWASGKFASRNICAEEECAALGMSFESARKALRNTPDPA